MTAVEIPPSTLFLNSDWDILNDNVQVSSKMFTIYLHIPLLELVCNKGEQCAAPLRRPSRMTVKTGYMVFRVVRALLLHIARQTRMSTRMCTEPFLSVKASKTGVRNPSAMAVMSNPRPSWTRNPRQLIWRVSWALDNIYFVTNWEFLCHPSVRINQLNYAPWNRRHR